MSTVQKPNKIFTVKIDGEDTAIAMSFALLQEVLKAIPSVEDISSLLVSDFHLRDYVARRVLTGNKRVNTPEDLIDLFDVDVDEAEIDDMLLWVADHVLYFFTKTAMGALDLGKKYQTNLSDLTQSLRSQTGSQD